MLSDSFFWGGHSDMQVYIMREQLFWNIYILKYIPFTCFSHDAKITL